MKRILGVVQRGQVVTVYSRKLPIAKIIPINKRQTEIQEVGFGMWKDYSEIADVNKYLRKIRKGRQHDI